MKLKPLRKDLLQYLDKHNLTKKWNKVIKLFDNDIRHPSLNTELLQPQWRGIYSFRIDQKYRALFFISEGKAEVFQITNHYKK
ncbi:MAG: type II toxin-antitoxin system YoeB family toxin [Bacteroidota bacterium]|nr:type II toxin-antitoxin system YoeB family toxin [Bacteroidota bacterium]